MLCVMYAQGKHPHETDIMCASRISSHRVTYKEDGMQDTKGRAMQKGGMHTQTGHRLLFPEYCSLCTMATPAQVIAGFLKSGCRFQKLSLHHAVPMKCVPKVGGRLMDNTFRGGGARDEYDCQDYGRMDNLVEMDTDFKDFDQGVYTIKKNPALVKDLKELPPIKIKKKPRDDTNRLPSGMKVANAHGTFVSLCLDVI